MLSWIIICVNVSLYREVDGIHFSNSLINLKCGDIKTEARKSSPESKFLKWSQNLALSLVQMLALKFFAVTGNGSFG